MSNFANDDFKMIVGYDENYDPIYRDMTFDDVQNMFPDSFDQATCEDIFRMISIPLDGKELI